MAHTKTQANSTHEAFEKLVEYEQRSESFAPGRGSGKDATGEWSGITFRIGNSRLACDSKRIHEVLSMPQATPVPGAKAWILGLANVRGALLTIVDLPYYLTGKRSSITINTRLLAAQLNKAPVGLLIDEVIGQRHFHEENASDAGLGEDSPFMPVVAKKHKVGTEVWHEFDLDRLFSSQEFLNGAAD